MVLSLPFVPSFVVTRYPSHKLLLSCEVQLAYFLQKFGSWFSSQGRNLFSMMAN